ncbi:hypothetical protein TWF594_006852 [Orbilia oligospora]|nr:hypothetical protein TWF594_006852 [Orbilia oligospora]
MIFHLQFSLQKTHFVRFHLILYSADVLKMSFDAFIHAHRDILPQIQTLILLAVHAIKPLIAFANWQAGPVTAKRYLEIEHTVSCRYLLLFLSLEKEFSDSGIFQT